MISVSVLIPSDDGDQYLLKAVEGRGWWLIHGCVGVDRLAKSTAQRIATEVVFYSTICLISVARVPYWNGEKTE